MSLEAAASVGEDFLLPGLNYTLGQTASYISGRRFATFWPQGSNVYNYATGQRVLRFTLTDPANGLLDLSSLRLAFVLRNTGTTNLLVDSFTPMVLFSRMRVFVGGQQVEDIMNLHRHVGMMIKLLPFNRAWSQSIEGLGGMESTWLMNGPENALLAANQSRNVQTPLHGSGLLASHYMLPVGAFSLTIELELADPNSVCVKGDGGTLSRSYELTQCRILGDVVSVDSAIQNQISSALLEGKALPLHFKTWSNSVHTVASGGGNFAVNLSRGFSRLSTIFVNFSNNRTTGQSTQWSEVSAYTNWHGRTNINPNQDTPYDFNADSYKAQLSIGSHVWPDYPISNNAEAYYRLSQALGHSGSLDGVTISPADYRSFAFIMSWDLDKAAGPGGGMAAMSGVNTKANNDLMRFTFDSLNQRYEEFSVDKMWIHCHFDVIVELRASGVVLLD